MKVEERPPKQVQLTGGEQVYIQIGTLDITRLSFCVKTALFSINFHIAHMEDDFALMFNSADTYRCR